METAILAAQQSQAQSNAALSMVKKSAQAEQAVVNMIDQGRVTDTRGQNLNITV